MRQRNIRTFVFGGLGNQMFQFAMGRALALRLNVPLRLNISAFAIAGSVAHNAWRLQYFPRILADNCCTVEDNPASFFHNLRRRLKVFALKKMHGEFPLFPDIVTEPHFEYWRGIERISAPCHLYGYWQSEKYFIKYADQIRKDFAFPVLPDGEPRALAARIKACPNAVAVHIRRGDYLSNPQTLAFHGLPGPEYYGAALARIRAEVGNTTIFLFSDDPRWVCENFAPCGHAFEVVDLNLPQFPQHDMHLMALCRHHIIANSSFSWWGAWLSTSEGMRLAPSRWFVAPEINADDIYPPAWIRV